MVVEYHFLKMEQTPQRIKEKKRTKAWRLNDLSFLLESQDKLSPLQKFCTENSTYPWETECAF